MKTVTITVELTISDHGEHDEYEILDWLNWHFGDGPMLDSFDPSALFVTRLVSRGQPEHGEGD